MIRDGNAEFDPLGIIKKIRAENWPVSQAICEFVDNSLGAGATDIEIEFKPSRRRHPAELIIRDNGGFPDPEQAVHYAIQKERPPDQESISEYHVGLKDAAWFLGDVLVIETVYRGHKTRCTVDPRIWGTEGRRPFKIEDGSDADDIPFEHGTRIVVRGLLPQHVASFTKRSMESIRRKLARTYAPALLRKSVQLTVICNGKTHAVHAEERHTLQDERQDTECVFSASGELEIEPTFAIRAGLVETSACGLYVDFGDRHIGRLDQGQQRWPPGLVAYVTLHRSCRRLLTAHKDNIREGHRASFLHVVNKFVEHLRRLLAERGRAVRISNVSFRLDGIFGDAVLLSDAAKSKPPEKKCPDCGTMVHSAVRCCPNCGHAFYEDRQQTDHVDDEEPVPPPDTDEKREKKEKQRHSEGVRLREESKLDGRTEPVRVQFETDGSVSILFSPNSDVANKVFTTEETDESLYFAIASLLATTFATLPEDELLDRIARTPGIKTFLDPDSYSEGIQDGGRREIGEKFLAYLLNLCEQKLRTERLGAGK